jgi:Icc-related predicted phosphoesterase
MSILSDLKERLNQEEVATEDEAGMEKAAGVTRLFFATDVHGSTACWRKFVNAAEFYSADVLVLGGDTTGKAIFPITEENGTYRYTRNEQEQTVETEEELETVRDSAEDAGYYPYVLTADEFDRLENAADAEERHDRIFHEQMVERIEEWGEFAAERLPADVPVYVSPGNDDPFEIDETWEAVDRVDLVESDVVEIDDRYEMASTGWSNRTPWDTPREEDEEALRERLERAIADVDDLDHAIFNFHVPPYDSQLDSAPELDEDLKPKYGAQTMEPVGSTAVRTVIEEYQPALSLHGHIHESRGKTQIGDTIAINPGSVYSEGSLQGAIVDLDDEVDVVGLVRG